MNIKAKRISLLLLITLMFMIVTLTFVACNFSGEQQKINDDTSKTPVTYTVVVYANGGQFADGSLVKNITVEQGTTITLPNLPTREGYELAGWATDSNGRNIFDIHSAISGYLEIYAVWEDAQQEEPATTEYSVTIFANGGKFSDGTTSKKIVVKEGATLDIDDIPERSGYIISGFATDKAGRDEWDIETPITQTTRIFVIWEKIEEQTSEHDVTFNLNYGSSSTVIKTTENGKVTYIPTRSGYDFYGWYTDANFTTEWKTDTKVTSDDLVLYAQWIEAATIGQLNAPKVSVSGDTFSWDRVSGASGYNIIVLLNNDEKYNNSIGSSYTTWTFPSSLIPNDEGIYNFTVKIRANGDGENTANSNYNTKTLKKNVRVLDPLTGIVFDEATGILSWGAVDYAENYTVSLNGKDVDTVKKTSFDMSSYEAGEYTAIITANKTNWQSSSASKAFTKRRILEPKVYVSVKQNDNGEYDYYLRWRSSMGADTYVLDFGTQKITVNNDNYYTLANTSSLWNRKDKLEFTIQGKDNDADYLNSPSKEKYTIQKLGSISVENSFGGDEGITITGEAFSPTRYIFDLNYDDLSFSRPVIEDEAFEYPHPKRDGYIFTGWYTTPECEKLYNFYPDLYEDTTVYAGWYACNNSMEVIEWSDNPTLKAYSLRAYESKDIYLTVYNTQGYKFLYKNSYSSSSYAVTFEMYDVTYDATHFNAVTCTNTSNRVISGTWDAGRVFRLRITAGSYATTAYCALMVGANTLHKYPTVSHSPWMPYSWKEGEQSADAAVLAGATYTLKATQQQGYTWVGWYKGDEKLSDEMTCEITASTTRTNYTANWVYYTVSTETNLEGAGTYTKYEDHKVTVGDEVTLTATTNNGYTWLGWYDGDTKVCEDLSYTFTMPAENKTYTANWTYYTISTNTNMDGAGTYTTKSAVKTTAGTSVTLTATTNNSYTWLGWYDGDTKVCDDLSYTFVMPAEDKTYTAKWGKVTLEQNNTYAGTISSLNDKYVVGDEVTVTAYTNNGYTWLGWYDGDTKICDDLSYTFTMPAENKTYTATWTYYTLSTTTNMSEAGTYTSKSDVKITAGTSVTLTASTNSGYTWFGWYDGETKVCDELSYTFTMPAENKMYTAKWMECPITIEKNIAEAGNVSGDVYGGTIVGADTTIIAITNNGYTWLGWYDGETKVCDDLIYSFTMPAESKTYTAKWSKVTISRNNTSAGTVTSLTNKYVVGDEATVTATTNYGYTWLGWYDGETKVCDDLTYFFTMPAEDKTYTAKWSKVTLERNKTSAGTVTSLTNKYVVGDEATVTATTNYGYTWLGWYDGDTKVCADLSYTFNMPAEDKTYTATWACYTLTTTTNMTGAGTYTTKSAVKTTAGTSITLTTTATHIGYTWLGWYDGNIKVCDDLSYTFNMPAESKTYIAKWVVVEQMNNFNFTSTTTTCQITGVKDKTVTEIIVPDYVTSIGSSAFTYCTGLTSVTIGNSVTTLPAGLFSGCSSLESITIPFVGAVAGKTSSDTYQYPFGYIFGTSSYPGGTTVTQFYYGSSTSSTTNKTTYYIPSTLRSVTVTGGNILRGAFYNCSMLTSITIPNSVTSIGDRAFYYCSGLTSITIPNSVTTLPAGLFSGCSSLESITIPFVGAVAGQTSGDTYPCPFGYIFGTSSYHGGTTVTQSYYGSSTSFNIPSTLRSVTVTGGNILRGAFYNCSMLTSITIPNSVTSIGSGAFYNCTGLTTINYTGDIAGWCLISGLNNLMAYGSSTKSLYINGALVENLVIPDGVTTIPSYAFVGCTGLTSVTIPNSVTSIGSQAFYNCTGLTSVTIPDSVTSIGSRAFSGCPIEMATIPAIACSSIRNSSLKTVVITNGKSIESDAFFGCSGLTSITIPDGVTSIGSSAFYNCKGLTSIIIPDSVTSIGDEAFAGCHKLIEVYNKSSLEIAAGSRENGWAGYYAKNVYTEEGGSKLLTDENGYIIYTDGEDKILVSYTDNDTELALPNDIIEIYRYAFYGRTGLTSITIPDSVTSICEGAFQGCGGLTSITIPNSVTSIDYHAFYGCTGLTSITFEGTQAQWNSISKRGDWNSSTGNYTIHCTDGDIAKS